jgi:CRISPR-associated endonuclease/helicase Cas3
VTTTLDLAFPLAGRRVPLDHGYALYSAVSRLRPELHATRWLGIHPLAGEPDAEGALQLRRGADLRFRIPAEHVASLLPLAGATLIVAGEALSLGIPRAYPLVPAATVDARLVVINLTKPPLKTAAAGARPTLDVAAFAESYVKEIRRQLGAIGVEGEPTLCGRQRMTVAGKRVVGYSVRVAGLSPEHSLRLQAAGIGGKRGMGCGIFRVTRG